MKKRIRNIILAVVGLQFIIIIGVLALPSVVGAIPGRYRVALAERNPFISGMTEGVIDAVAPVATALPAPEQNSGGEEVDFAALIAANDESANGAATPRLAPTNIPAIVSQEDGVDL